MIDEVFVGRDAELAGLRAGYEDARAGCGRVWLVTGEPGIGKTRLAEELAASAPGAVVAWGRCWEGGGAPAFLPWTQALRTLGLDGALIQAGASRDPDAARFELFDAVASALRTAAETCPVVVILDDLHAADHASLLLMRFVAGQVHDMRVFVVGTCRDTAPDPSVSELVADITRVGRSIELQGLDPAAVEQLVHAASVRVTEQTVRALHEASGGNPLFLRELVEAQGTTPHIPATVREAIRRRVGAMSRPAQDALSTAAVLGRDFDADAVSEVASVGRIEVLEALAEAERERLLKAVDDRIFRFTHGLVRETLYATLGPARCLELHGAAARVLEQRHGVDPSIVAHHWFHARDPAKALEHSRRAAELASRQLAFEEAAAQYERAIQAFDLGGADDPALRCDLHIAAAESRWRSGDPAAARAAFALALEAAELLADGQRYARAALGHAGPPETAEFDAPLAQPLRRALELAPGEALRASVLARLSHIFVNTGHAAEGLEAGREALRAARVLADPETLAFVLRCTFYNVWEPDLGARLRDTKLLIDSGVPETEVTARCWRAAVHLVHGDISAFDVELGIAAQLADRLHQPYLSWLVTVSRATRACIEGRFAESERLATEALQTGPQMTAVVDGYGVQMLFLRFLTGGFAELEPVMRTAVEQFPASLARRAGLAWLLAEAGRLDEAAAEFEPLAHAGFEDVPHDFLYLLSLQILGLVGAALGDADRARLLYDLLLPYEDWNVVAGVSSGFLGSVRFALGLLADAAGRRDDALRHLAEAQVRHDAMGARPWSALTRFERARLLQAAGDPNPALLEEAALTADEIGMHALTERIAALRDRAGTRDGFRREGQFWSVLYRGKLVRLRDVKGMRDIAYLLARPGQEIHALDLQAAAERAAPAAAQRRVDAGSADAVLDERARRELRDRVRELEEELAEAEGWTDTARAARLREELDFVRGELAAAFGLGGRARKLGDPAERARKAVKGRIDDALTRIERELPDLARHLRRSIRTGTFCMYAPVDPASWTF